jgi:hypothetical protein
MSTAIGDSKRGHYELGDWKSDAVFRYFEVSPTVKMSYYKMFSKGLPTVL